VNWANRLTVARFFLTLLFVAALTSELPFSRTTALVLFIIASITDWVDGHIARTYGLITDFGKLMDPLVDKIMMAAAFICLIPLGAFPAWVVVIIISREFLITGLRLLALSKGQILAAENLGKHKTIWQIIAVLWFLLLLSIREIGLAKGDAMLTWWSAAWIWGGGAIMTVAVVFTVWSGLGYVWKNRAVIRPE
jgi:CDP-diacylglycerol--glycerol-3-phosphate 3-phosphatidyltransferase